MFGASKLALIEDFKRYDQSRIWDIHNEYFLNTGIKAWTKGEIPYSGVTNYEEAYKKVRLIIENLKTIRGRESRPVRVLEVGAGLGEFAKNFLQAFSDISKQEGLRFYDDLEFYFSDYSEKTIEEVKESGRLEDFKDKICFHRFDVMAEANFLSKEELANGFFDVILCSYLLDQLPARIFARTGTGFKEKYQRLELDEKIHGKVKKPRKWIKKLKKIVEYRDVDLEDDHTIPSQELNSLYPCFRKDKESTVVYSYGALNAVKNFMGMINPEGIIICSDFNASTKGGIDKYEPCYYGNSLAQAVNFELIFNYFSDSAEKVLLYEDPIRPLHTLILTRKDFQYALELGRKYDLVFKQNLIFKFLYKYLIELQFAFGIFAVVLLIFIVVWLFQTI